MPIDRRSPTIQANPTGMDAGGDNSTRDFSALIQLVESDPTYQSLKQRGASDEQLSAAMRSVLQRAGEPAGVISATGVKNGELVTTGGVPWKTLAVAFGGVATAGVITALAAGGGGVAAATGAGAAQGAGTAAIPSLAAPVGSAAIPGATISGASLASGYGPAAAGLIGPGVSSGMLTGAGKGTTFGANTVGRVAPAASKASTMGKMLGAFKGGGMSDYALVALQAILPALMGGGNEDPYKDIVDESDPRARFINPKDALYNSNRSLASAGLGISRRLAEPTTVKAPTGLSSGRSLQDFSLPGLDTTAGNQGGLPDFLDNLISPTASARPARRRVV